jgi:hypothetical protein
MTSDLTKRVSLLLLSVALFSAAGCEREGAECASGRPGCEEQEPCSSGETRSCIMDGGEEGIQTCSDRGERWNEGCLVPSNAFETDCSFCSYIVSWLVQRLPHKPSSADIDAGTDYEMQQQVCTLLGVEDEELAVRCFFFFRFHTTGIRHWLEYGLTPFGVCVMIQECRW